MGGSIGISKEYLDLINQYTKYFLINFVDLLNSNLLICSFFFFLLPWFDVLKTTNISHWYYIIKYLTSLPLNLLIWIKSIKPISFHFFSSLLSYIIKRPKTVYLYFFLNEVNKRKGPFECSLFSSENFTLLQNSTWVITSHVMEVTIASSDLTCSLYTQAFI